jgi:hypothetical protein
MAGISTRESRPQQYPAAKSLHFGAIARSSFSPYQDTDCAVFPRTTPHPSEMRQILSTAVKIMISVALLCSAFMAGRVIHSIATPISRSGISVGSTMLITLMPIPGWEVREVTMGRTFQYAGLIANEDAKVLLRFSAVNLIVGAFGGMLWILNAEKSTQRAALIEL